MLTVTLVIPIWLLSIFSEYFAINQYSHASRRNIFAILSIIGICVAPLILSFYSFSAGLLIGFIGFYRIVNNARLLAARLPLLHAQSIMRRTVLLLSLLQAVVLAFYISTLFVNYAISSQDVVISLVIASAVGAIIIFIATVANIFESQPQRTQPLTNNEYPTVTVAIAARNETPTLMECLESVVASTYSKLEILVFDDNSQDTTAEIIKSFAQDGVRFIPWEYSKDEWISKNKAYQILLEHASGDIIVYMGVDVRLQPTSLQKAVEQMLQRDVSMLGLVPKRTKSGLLALFVQPMRYWWELAVPKIARRRPPVLSTVWLVNRTKLLTLGGFTSYKRSIAPEEHIARRFTRLASYAFVRATNTLDFTTQKTFSSQWDTQIRTRYPHVHRRPETTLVQTVLLFCLVLWPFIMLPLTLIYTVEPIIIIVTASAVVTYTISHIAISIITNPIAGLFAPLNFPIAVALDVIALHVSMYKYEFSKLIWKGRDIAPKKLEVITKLPSIESIPNSENKH